MNEARLIFPALRWKSGSGFSHLEPMIEQSLTAGVGGFIVFGGPAEQVERLTTGLRSASPQPLLIGADLERGAGQQFEGLQEIPPPAALGSLGDLDLIRRAGARTARDALSVGVDWIFAPVADLDIEPRNPIVQTRSFGADPVQVAKAVSSWIHGCQSSGALATAKHFPGHGRTVADSHVESPAVNASRRDLGADLAPFRAAVDAGVAAVMTAHVSYPALDPDRRPATLSPPIVSLLRQELGFDGLVVTDALNMAGVRGGPDGDADGHRGERPAALEALIAGVDALLYPEDLARTVAALGRGLDEGHISQQAVDDSIRRLDRARTRVDRARGSAGNSGDLAAFADAADRLCAAQSLRRAQTKLRAPLEIQVVDDDAGGAFPVGPSDLVQRELSARGLGGAGGSRVLLVFSEPRGWKGTAGFTEDGLKRLEVAAPDADLVVLFGHPRLCDLLPGGSPVKVAWHRQPLMQQAVARWLEAQVS